MTGNPPPPNGITGARPVPDGGDRQRGGSAARSDPSPEDRDRAGGAESEEFPRPPLSVTDDEGREIDIEVFDGDTDAVVEMYSTLDPADRSQGIPPRGESRIRSWVETLTEEGLNLLARHGEDVVGHAVLMPMDEGRWELAIFVHSDYQEAHIGTTLLRCLLGYGDDQGVERVWLSVERHNTIALSLYESLGFEKLSGDMEFKMERTI